MDPALESVSPAEQVLVEKSQDSVHVTKNRLHRLSLKSQIESDRNAPCFDVDPRQDSLAQARRRLGQAGSGGTAEVTAISPGKQRKKPKTRFSTDPEEESLGLEEGTKADRQERKKSIGRRISEALQFRKAGTQPTTPTAVEGSPPSVHVKFSQQAQVID